MAPAFSPILALLEAKDHAGRIITDDLFADCSRTPSRMRYPVALFPYPIHLGDSSEKQL
jgi:hypothetical protein